MCSPWLDLKQEWACLNHRVPVNIFSSTHTCKTHTLFFPSHTHTNPHSLKWSYTKSIGNLTNLQAIYHNKCLCLAFDIEHWEAGIRALTSLLLYYNTLPWGCFRPLSGQTELPDRTKISSIVTTHVTQTALSRLHAETGSHTYIYSCPSTPWRDEKCSRLEKKTCTVALNSTILLFYCIWFNKCLGEHKKSVKKHMTPNGGE